MIGNRVIILLALLGVFISDMSQAQQDYLRDWELGAYGGWIGGTGFGIADIDADGIVEIVCAASTGETYSADYWYIVDYGSGYADKTMSYISPVTSNHIMSLCVFDHDDDGVFNIYIGWDDGAVDVYDGRTVELIASLRTTAGPILDIEIADAGNDGVEDLVFCTDLGVYIVDLPGMEIATHIPTPARHLKVGNVDSDAFLEIVTNSGVVIQVVNEEATVEWEYEDAFGSVLDIGDIDGDGVQEIVGMGPGSEIMAYDAISKTRIWLKAISSATESLRVVDYNGDGSSEIFYGQGFWTNLNCYDPVAHLDLWSIENPTIDGGRARGTTSVEILDIDQDGVMEVIWGAGSLSGGGGSSALCVYDCETQDREWISQSTYGEYGGMEYADLTGDGNLEAVYFTNNNGRWIKPEIYIRDAVTHELDWTGRFPDSSSLITHFNDLEIGDVDDDGVTEFVIAADARDNGGALLRYAYDPNIGMYIQEKHTYYEPETPIQCMAIGDVDSDGSTEIVALVVYEAGYFLQVSYVYVVDGRSLDLEWKSPALSDQRLDHRSLDIGDIDGDGIMEIAALSGSLFIFDGVTHEQWITDDTKYELLSIVDRDGDGTPEILLCNGNMIRTYPSRVGVPDSRIYVPSETITGIWLGRLGQSPDLNIVYTDGQRVFVLRDGDAMPMWQSRFLGDRVGETYGLAVADAGHRHDGLILVGMANRVIQYRPSGLVSNYMTHFTADRLNGAVVLDWECVPRPIGESFRIWRRISDCDLIPIGDQRADHGGRYGFVDYPEPGASADYWLEEIRDGKESAWFGPVGVEDILNRPLDVGRLELYPNPFNSKTTIKFNLVEPQRVEVAVYDISGRRVRVLLDGYAANEQTLEWNGRNAAGQVVSSGGYFIRISGQKFSEVQKVMLVQ